MVLSKKKTELNNKTQVPSAERSKGTLHKAVTSIDKNMLVSHTAASKSDMDQHGSATALLVTATEKNPALAGNTQPC